MSIGRGRRTNKIGDEGLAVEAVRPYLMDLGSTNGTFINSEQLEAQRYYELMEKVTLALHACYDSKLPFKAHISYFYRQPITHRQTDVWPAIFTAG